jgi:hypothetical protein
VSRIQPCGGPPRGRTIVTLTGVGFEDFGGGLQGAKCRFGNVVVPASITSHQEARCVTPDADLPASTPVWLTLNGYADARGATGGRLHFHFVPPAELRTLHPLGETGRGGSGSLVTITGTGFHNIAAAEEPCPFDAADSVCRLRESALARGSTITEPQCIFGAVASPATLFSEGALLCRAPLPSSLSGTVALWPYCAGLVSVPHCTDPAYAETPTVALRVTLNGNEAAASLGLPWMLLPRVTISYATLWIGAETGGTNVTIVGDGLLFIGGAVCRFGHVQVPAVVGGAQFGNPAHALSNAPRTTQATMHDGRSSQTIARAAGQQVTCTSPPGSLFDSPTVSLDVSLDGGVRFTGGLSFRYTKVVPFAIGPEGGPVAGGTEVRIQRTGYQVQSSGIACAFDNSVVPATSVSLWDLKCISPPRTAMGTVGVRLILNGDDAHPGVAGATFMYYDASFVVVSAISPAGGPSDGGTLITLSGQGFLRLGTPMCQFGVLPSVMAAHTTLADGSLVTDRLVCRTPYHARMGDGTEEVPMFLSLNGQQFHAALSYRYEARCFGRDLLEHYDADAQDEISRYVVANRPALDYDDGDGKLSAVEIATAVSGAGGAGIDSSSEELRLFASTACSQATTGPTDG